MVTQVHWYCAIQ